MNSFAAKLRLKGMAEEDIYFAKLDQELIAALRQKKRQQESDETSKSEVTSQQKESDTFH